MDAYPVKFDIGREVAAWLEGLGYNQAVHVLTWVAKLLKFAEENMEFFQGCGLYVTGSSLRGNNFNDIDLVLAGLDFRAVVDYDQVFLMDPEKLIEKKILVEPNFFVVIDSDKQSGVTALKPIMEAKDNNLLTWVHQFNHAGMEHKGKEYYYNFREFGDIASNLTGYCSGRAGPSDLTKAINKLFNPADEFSWNLSHPFDHYGFDGRQPFLVYCIRQGEEESNLPVAEGTVIEEGVKPIETSIHAENLRREAWKDQQRSLRLPYLTLKEWPEVGRARRIMTNLEYPDFIDPSGIKRAELSPLNMGSYWPEEPAEVIENSDKENGRWHRE
ncbi:MAG: hypothetical protein A3J76_01840 [Candidatus Moranbacteria bacterium RBG_13_45_13]|nr:MAG: hypothetical protein A3J76_01840 [Candidatus Moranbacteria bacterium RBG_13_45_13]